MKFTSKLILLAIFAFFMLNCNNIMAEESKSGLETKEEKDSLKLNPSKKVFVGKRSRPFSVSSDTGVSTQSKTSTSVDSSSSTKLSSNSYSSSSNSGSSSSNSRPPRGSQSQSYSSSVEPGSSNSVHPDTSYSSEQSPGSQSQSISQSIKLSGVGKSKSKSKSPSVYEDGNNKLEITKIGRSDKSCRCSDNSKSQLNVSYGFYTLMSFLSMIFYILNC
uniref:Uncharacterized protein n=1 Tax=Strongyloides stercoralis TaxID=6248 RepID=A0A0K0EM10_STRER